MKFSRLRLSGFKSFVDPSELIIGDGLTGVVGPNGCGKSNLLEALRWVMGETSPKSMRGSGMEDVIFAGTQGRSARNFSEVTLLIDNKDRDAPPGFNESDDLEISRRIQRDAGSSYRVNGKDTRARDVQTLFADAATGAHSPSLVRQGQIGQLINAKPKARRAILEEAAGIGGLYSRRHEAELRLRGAETNLERLDDITGNLDQQLSGLKRQARQATRYKNLSQHIRRAESILLHLRHQEAARAVARAEETLRAADGAVAKATLEAGQAEKGEQTASDSLTPLREKATIAAAILQRLKIEQENLEAQEAQAQAHRGRLSGRLEQTKGDVIREEELIGDARAALSKITDERTTLEDAPRDTEAEKLTAEAVATAEAEMKTLEEQADNLVRELASLKADRAALERDVNAAGHRKTRLEEELAGARSALGALGASAATSEQATAQAHLTEAQAALETTEQNTLQADRTRSGLEEREAALRAPLQEAEQALARLRAEADTLAAMLAQPDGNKSAPLMDEVTVKPGYEQALGAALGDDLDAPSDETALLHWRSLPPISKAPALPKGAEPLSKHVKGPTELHRRLSQIGVIEPADGARLQADLQPGQRLVSPEGDLWRWDGFTTKSDAPGSAASRLAQKNRLIELEAELAKTEPLTQDLRKSTEQTQAALKAAIEADREARTASRDAQGAMAKAERVRADIQATMSAEAARQDALTESTEKLKLSIVEAGQDYETAAKSLTTLKPTDDLESQSTALRTKVETARVNYSEARSTQENIEREQAARSARLDTLRQDEAAWHERTETADTRIATLRQRITETEEELTAALAEQNTEDRREVLFAEITKAETAAAETGDKLAEAETITRELREIARQAVTIASEARETRARSDALLEGARERLTEAAARTREVLECDPQDVLERASIAPDEQLPPLPEIETRVEKLKRERDQVGAVNLRAEEEMKELQDQRDALEVEGEDLIAAITRLRQGIQSLNKEGRERMLAAFNEVNEHFKALFTHLFGGGEASLELIESDDPLDAGLEIMAQPPGKKTRSLSLLSGGEQALTAMALIFAVFLTNPAPICVLDEVDAPLDDANVERFCAMLEEMTRRTDTRFLIITHHSLTMSRMDRLFGVTMAEKGVSQLVSVDLANAERIKAA